MSPVPVVIGGAVAALVLLLGWQPWRRGGASSSGAGARPFGPLASALAGPVAVLVTLYANASKLSLPPRKYLDWVLLAALLSIGLVGLRGRGKRSSIGLFALGAGVLAYFPTRSLHERYWGDERVAWLVGLVLAFVLAFLVAQRALTTRRAEGASALALAALGSAPALGLSGTGSAALLVASLGGVALLVTGLALVRRDLRPWEGFAPTFAALHAGLVASGVLYAETPLWAGLALVLAPAFVLLPGGSVRVRLARLVLVAVTVALAVWSANPPPRPYGGY
jgi:hypothetical protein